MRMKLFLVTQHSVMLRFVNVFLMPFLGDVPLFTVYPFIRLYGGIFPTLSIVKCLILTLDLTPKNLFLDNINHVVVKLLFLIPAVFYGYMASQSFFSQY